MSLLPPYRRVELRLVEYPRSGGFALEAWRHGTRIGVVEVRDPPGGPGDAAPVEWISVDEKHRRHGVATLLYLAAAREACRRWGSALLSHSERSREAEGVWQELLDRSIATFDEDGNFLIPCSRSTRG